MLARARESAAPVVAHQLWRRILCLDPASQTALGGIARTFPIAIHRPPVTVVEGVAPELHSWVRDPWDELGQGLIVYVEPPPPPPAKFEPLFNALDRTETPPELLATESELALAPAVVIEPEPEIDWAALAAERARVIADLDEQIAEAGEALRTARFRFGLIALEEVRVALGNLEAGDDLSSLHVRLETLAATAHVALGQQTEALESLLRALDADPDLALDPLTTSPKVLRALRLARATRVRSVEAE